MRVVEIRIRKRREKEKNQIKTFYAKEKKIFTILITIKIQTFVCVISRKQISAEQINSKLLRTSFSVAIRASLFSHSCVLFFFFFARKSFFSSSLRENPFSVHISYH